VLTVNITAGIVYDKYWELSSVRRVTDANPNHPGYQHCLNHSFAIATMALTCLSSLMSWVQICCLFKERNLAVRFPCMLPSELSSRFSSHSIIFIMIVAWFTEVSVFFFVPNNEIHNLSDVKPQNIMVSMNVSDATIADYLDKNPATLYEPRKQPDISVDPIITVKSQPLPDFGLNPTLNNLVVKLADYGEGKRSQEYFRVSQTDPTKPFQLRRST